MDRSQIGNARQQNDNRIAVSDALRLDECHRSLVEIVQASELQPSDFRSANSATYAWLSDGMEPSAASVWVKANLVRDKAARMLGEAIATGELQVWRIHEAAEVRLVPMRLADDDIRYGMFKTFERPEPDMQGAVLWVKSRGWEKFCTSFANSSSFDDAIFHNKKLQKPPRKKPGPKPHYAWPQVIDAVVSEAMAAGYKKAGSRGHKNNIINMLIIKMASIADWDCSEAIARRHLPKVIERLPE